MSPLSRRSIYSRPDYRDECCNGSKAEDAYHAHPAVFPINPLFRLVNSGSCYIFQPYGIFYCDDFISVFMHYTKERASGSGAANAWRDRRIPSARYVLISIEKVTFATHL